MKKIIKILIVIGMVLAASKGHAFILAGGYGDLPPSLPVASAVW